MAWTRTKKVLVWTGGLCTVIGAIDLPDQIQDWIKFFQSLKGMQVNWESNILGNAGRWAFTIVGVLLLLWAYQVPSLILERFGWRLAGPVTRKKQNMGQEEAAFPPPGFISLQEAARKFYEESRRNRTGLALAADNMSNIAFDPLTIKSGNENDRLDHVATEISRNLTIWGARPPSTELAEILRSEVKDRVFADGASTLKDAANDSDYFTNLCVKREEFDQQFNMVSTYERLSS